MRKKSLNWTSLYDDKNKELEENLKDRSDIEYFESIEGTYINKDSLLNYAKIMRKKPTEAEAILWDMIRNKKTGYKFRRQHPIGNFIVDFVNLDSGIIIEVDGKYHLEETQKQYDKLRTEYLSTIGYKELRFKNEEIICDPNRVLKIIINKIKSILDNHSSI